MRETPKAEAAFREYCALGPDRSLAKLTSTWQTCGKPAANLRQLEAWSSVHDWQKRIKAYDTEQFKEKQCKRDADIEAMNERHALMGMDQQAKAIKQIEALTEAKKFGSQAAVALLKLATDLERLARGAPTEHVEQSGSVEWVIELVGSSTPEDDNEEEG